MTAYVPMPLSDGVPAEVQLFLPQARNGELVICAGAGLSVADDSGLPNGRELAERLDRRLEGRFPLYVSPAETDDLLAVADAGRVATAELHQLQTEVAGLARFLSAPRNYGHRALALLIAEGALA